jgi:shikimate 5-dehydrogenase
VISGIEMLLWQALAQVRVFSEGDPTKEVFNEGAVMLAMRHSIGLI